MPSTGLFVNVRCFAKYDQCFAAEALAPQCRLCFALFTTLQYYRLASSFKSVATVFERFMAIFRSNPELRPPMGLLTPRFLVILSARMIHPTCAKKKCAGHHGLFCGRHTANIYCSVRTTRDKDYKNQVFVLQSKQSCFMPSARSDACAWGGLVPRFMSLQAAAAESQRRRRTGKGLEL